MASAAATQTPAHTTARSHLPWIIGLAIVARVLGVMLYFHVSMSFRLTNWGYENVSIALSILAGGGYLISLLLSLRTNGFHAARISGC